MNNLGVFLLPMDGMLKSWTKLNVKPPGLITLKLSCYLTHLFHTPLKLIPPPPTVFDVDLRDCLCNNTFWLGWSGGSGIAAIDRVTVKFFCFEMELSQQFCPRLKVTLRFKYVLVPFIHQRNNGNNTMAAAGFISLKFIWLVFDC